MAVIGDLSLDDLLYLEVLSGKVASRCLLGAIVCLLLDPQYLCMWVTLEFKKKKGMYFII